MTITRAAVHHRPKSADAYAYDEATIHVRLRTKRGEPERCTLLHGDKYDWPASLTRTPMERVGDDERFTYWQAEVDPPNRRLCYAFRLDSGEEALWFTEWGFESANETELPTAGAERTLHYFEYPFLNPIDVHDPPEWARDAVFYQIFPERFANGDPSRDPEDVEEWDTIPDRETFVGGDLRGIVDNLDYVEELGVTALYLTPVFESPSNHKYDTTDYLRIDPHFGDEETLCELVSAAHDRGIRVVLDAVFNHCGWEFAPFQDVLEEGADSEYADWFHVHEFPIETEPRPSYDAFAFVPGMPKLNTGNPEVREYLTGVATHWIEVADIDGWRLDVANEVDHRFLRELRRAVKERKPEAYVLGELWHDASAWLRGDQFDAVMDYPFSYAVYEFLATEEMDATGFAERLTALRFRYPEQVTEVLFTLLSSHDTPRLLHRCGGELDRMRLALFVQLTTPGTPCLYYGDEVGMTGGDDPDCRRPMVWDREAWNRELHRFVRELIALRHDSPALRLGRLSFDSGACRGDRLIYRRTTGEEGETRTIGVNRGDVPTEVDLPSGAEPTFETDPGATERLGEGRWRLPARSGTVWR